MNDRADKQRLLEEVLAEASPPDFRAALLNETLRLARRRRHWRTARHAGGILTVLILAVLGVWQNRPGKISPARPQAQTPVTKNYEVVRTRPLPAGAIVATRDLPGVETISSSEPVKSVSTTSGGFHLINDEQLLALVHQRAAVLIRTGPNSEELVFASYKN